MTITVALAAWIAWTLAMVARTDTDGLNAGERHLVAREEADS